MKVLLVSLAAMMLTGCATQEALALVDFLLQLIILTLLAPQAIKEYRK